MKRLSINIDHVATLRNNRGTKYPEVVYAAGLCELAGADGITVHLREDRRHIKDRDVYLLKDILNIPLNLEMAATEEIKSIALQVVPHLVTLVPEKRQELTTEGGLDVTSHKAFLKEYIKAFKDKGTFVSIFVEPNIKMIEECKEIGADFIELHTGTYCNLEKETERNEELQRLDRSAYYAKSIGLKVNAGHGLYISNIKPILKIDPIEEYSIGHGIISRAIFIGLVDAIKEIKILFNE